MSARPVCRGCDGLRFGAEMEHNCFEDVTSKNGTTEATQVFECPCCHSVRQRAVRIPTAVYHAVKDFWHIPREDPLFPAARAIRDGEGVWEEVR